MVDPGLHDDDDERPSGERGGRHRRSRRTRSTQARSDTLHIDAMTRELGRASDSTMEHPLPSDVTAAIAPIGDEEEADESPALETEAAEPSFAGHRKGGRNIPQSLAVGGALALVAGVPLVAYRPAFIVIIAAAVAIAIVELVSAMTKSVAHPPLAPLLVGGVGSVVVVWFAGVEVAVVGLLVTLVAVMLWRLPDGPVGYARDVTAAALIALYVPFLAAFVVLLLLPDDGSWRVITFIVTTIASDIGGFATGSLFGRHRMSPLVSPNKSWEGFAGSVASCVIVGTVFLMAGLDGSWWQGVVFGAAMAVGATVGDLAESLLKRDLGVKDMGRLLPGHGGVMDRFDSLLATAPIAYVLLTLFTPPA